MTFCNVSSQAIFSFGECFMNVKLIKCKTVSKRYNISKVLSVLISLVL